MHHRFPDNFWWGSASSALQTEGCSLQGGKSATTGITGSHTSRIVSITVLARPIPPAFINTGGRISRC